MLPLPKSHNGDGYIAIAFVAALAIILIALMKPMKIVFDAPRPMRRSNSRAEESFARRQPDVLTF